jgi:hypothetical protein
MAAQIDSDFLAPNGRTSCPPGIAANLIYVNMNPRSDFHVTIRSIRVIRGLLPRILVAFFPGLTARQHHSEKHADFVEIRPIPPPETSGIYQFFKNGRKNPYFCRFEIFPNLIKFLLALMSASPYKRSRQTIHPSRTFATPLRRRRRSGPIDSAVHP